MFTETLIATFLLGAIAGLGLAYIAVIVPLLREQHANQLARLREARQRLYRAEIRRKHLGTPYITPKPTGFEQLLADIGDNDRWSRKAPADLPENVRSIGGTR